jgi:hypothetical protein
MNDAAAGKPKPPVYIIHSALQNESLVLDFSDDDTTIPTTQREDPSRPDRQQWQTTPEGRIQNVAQRLLSGYLTRGDDGVTLTLTGLGDDASQVWHLEPGPGRDEHGPPGRRYYTHVRRPAADIDGTVLIITANGEGEAVTLVPRALPYVDDQSWDGAPFHGSKDDLLAFNREAGPQGQADRPPVGVGGPTPATTDTTRERTREPVG